MKYLVEKELLESNFPDEFEDGYFPNIENGIEDFKDTLNRLYSECEHGDDEHRKWLKNKFEDFYNKETA